MKCDVEPLESCWDELVAMTKRHFTGLGISYAPSRERYKAFEDAGGMFIVTLRDGAALVGYAIMYVFESMHDQSRRAQEDFFFVQPAHRQGWAPMPLLHVVEAECLKRGCEEIKMTVDTDNPVGAILCARGYDVVSRGYRKSLVRADSPSETEAVQ